MKRLISILALATSSFAGVLNQISAAAIEVNSSTATTISCNLGNTTTVQMYIRPSSSAQVFTLALPNGTTVEVPSGGTLTLRSAQNLQAGDTIGTVITGTGAATLQVIFFRETKQ